MCRTEDSRLALRKQYIGARESIPPSLREAYSRCAVERIAALPEFSAAHTVMLYRAVRGELSLESLPLLPASAGKRFAYPRCVGRDGLTAWIPGSWETGAFGIQEPATDTSEAVRPADIDLVICPGTAFDDLGTRLGMGGGYYDRFLPECVNAVFLMAAFEVQHAALLPRSATDVSMNLIVTEAAVRRIRERSLPCG